MINKIINDLFIRYEHFIKTMLIITLLFFLQGCYLFCLFKSDSRMESIVENFVEERMSEEGKK